MNAEGILAVVGRDRGRSTRTCSSPTSSPPRVAPSSDSHGCSATTRPPRRISCRRRSSGSTARPGTIRDLGRAPAFLRSIVINLARDHNRRGLMSLRHRATTHRSDVHPGFEDEAVGNEADRAVLTAVRLLPDRQRACVVLRFYLQYSESETADTLGISKNSVKTHCRRALASLETVLEDDR